MSSCTCGQHVQADTYERSLYAQMRAALPALKAVHQEFDELAQDTTLLLWQAAPRVGETSRSGGQAHCRVVSTLLGSAGVARLRTVTVHDAFASAYATVSLAPVLRRLTADPDWVPVLDRKLITKVTATLQRQASAELAFGTDASWLRTLPVQDQVRLATRLSGEVVEHLLRLADRLGPVETLLATPGTGDVVGQQLSGRLEDLLPSELAALTGPGRLELLSRLAEGRVRTVARQAPDTRGPLIVCVDTSHSMQQDQSGSTREAWAKALALVLIKRALAHGRTVTLFLFASENAHVRLKMTNKDRKLDQLLSMLETSLGGGTNFASVLAAAAHEISSDRSRADVVFVTDAQCRLRPQQVQRLQADKAALGFRIFAVTIGDEPVPFADEIIPFESLVTRASNGRFTEADVALARVGYERGEAAS